MAGMRVATSSRFREVIEEGATVTSKKTLKGFFSINGSIHTEARRARVEKGECTRWSVG